MVPFLVTSGVQIIGRRKKKFAWSQGLEEAGTPYKKDNFNLSWEDVRRVAKGEEGWEDSPPARLKQVQFALNRKHAFFDAMP